MTCVAIVANVANMLNDDIDDEDHVVCDCCRKSICLRGDACFSPACPDVPGRRVGPPAADLCEACATEWEAEERALRAVAASLNPDPRPRRSTEIGRAVGEAILGSRVVVTIEGGRRDAWGAVQDLVAWDVAEREANPWGWRTR